MRRYYPQYLQPEIALLRGQFILCGKDSLVPRGWESRTHGRWTLAWSSPLACASLVDAHGRTIAWVLGHAVTAEGRYLASGSSQVLSEGVTGLQPAIDGLAGRFIVIDLAAPDPKLQLDPYGMLAAVYAPCAQCVASTGMLIPVTRETPWAGERIEQCGIPYRSAMYPLGFTPRHQVERVLPNHVLDLASWQVSRLWPLAVFDRQADPARITPRIGARIRAVLAAVAAAGPVQCPLTAGLDSRLLLACSRGLTDGMTFFTANLNDESGWQDIVASRQLAARFGLRHREDRWRRPRHADLVAWVTRTGGETGEVRGWRACRTLAQQEAGKATLTGFVGELARAYWWARLQPGATITPESIVRRCRVPLRAEFVERAAAWLAGLPPLDPVSTLEVLYLEQRGGCWAGVVEYGELGDSEGRLAPMNQALMIRDMLKLPDEYRRGAGVHFDLVRQYWPELLEIPFNEQVRIGGIRGFWYRRRPALREGVTRARSGLKRAVQDPLWAVQWLGRKARGLIGKNA